MWYVLVAVAAALLLLRFRLRERLEPTDKIKAPIRGRYDWDERQRIWSLIPESTRMAMLVWDDLDGSASKRWASSMVASFYDRIYAGATTPITEAMVDSFVLPIVRTDHREYAKTILKSYYLDQLPPPTDTAATGTTGPPPPAATGSTGPAETGTTGTSPAVSSPSPSGPTGPTGPVPAPTTTSLDSSSPVRITIQVRPTK